MYCFFYFSLTRMVKKLKTLNFVLMFLPVEGSKIYDKLCAVMMDLQKLGKSIQQTGKSYQMSMQKLCNGKGNLLGQAHKLKELGVETHRSLPNEKSYT